MIVCLLVADRGNDTRLAPAQVVDSVRQPFMSAPGTTVRIRAEIQIFVYGDAVARSRDTDRLDAVRVAPATMTVIWREPASLVTANNLAAIVLG